MRPRPGDDDQRQFEESLAVHRDFLRRLIRAKGFSLEELDRRFGFRRGYVSRVLKGETSLTLHHVLAILEAIDVPAGFYFSTIYPPPPRDSESEGEVARRLLRLLERALRSDGEAAAAALLPAEGSDTLEARIEQAVSEMLAKARPRTGRG